MQVQDPALHVGSLYYYPAGRFSFIQFNFQALRGHERTETAALRRALKERDDSNAVRNKLLLASFSGQEGLHYMITYLQQGCSMALMVLAFAGSPTI